MWLMTARNKEDALRCEMIEQVLQDILERSGGSGSGAVIVVEGKHDVAALRNLGICGKIVPLSGQPLLNFADMLACSSDSVIVLTDWDRRGNELAQRIVQYMQPYAVVVDTGLRDRLKKLVRKDIKDVQGLGRYLAGLQRSTIKSIKHIK
ncbi:MAG: toprim domain-containing protein [Methanosarcinales archaeon]|nr:MAG: toprim domain-containing protein [Methanosarcinales archaeon]